MHDYVDLVNVRFLGRYWLKKEISVFQKIESWIKSGISYFKHDLGGLDSFLEILTVIDDTPGRKFVCHGGFY